MWSALQPRSERAAAFTAWIAWRQAADHVQAAWEDVLKAARGTRPGAYAMYTQALRHEELAARELGAQMGLTPAAEVDIPRMAA
jgi:hypothetical protein